MAAPALAGIAVVKCPMTSDISKGLILIGCDAHGVAR